MAKIIDVNGLLGRQYEERQKQRKIDRLWGDLERMSEEEFVRKYNVQSAGPMMNEITDDSEEEFEYILEEDFEQLTDEDLK